MTPEEYAAAKGYAAKRRMNREYRILNRLCVYCGKPLEDSEIYQACAKCRAKRSKKARGKNKSYKKQGLCQNCHEPLPEEDKEKHFVNCAKCREYNRIRYQAYRTNNTDKEQSFQKRAKEKWERYGNPTHCRCGAPLEYGYVTCSKCRAKSKELYYKKKQKQMKDTNQTKNENFLKNVLDFFQKCIIIYCVWV